jgi:hypothetical protein
VGKVPRSGGCRWFPDSGCRAGLHSGVRSEGQRSLVFARGQVDPASGWLPKNPALSLAMSRASPASIRMSPGRNQELNGLAHWTPAGPFAGPRKPAARRLPARSSPEYIPMDSCFGAIRLALRCLAGNRLARSRPLDSQPNSVCAGLVNIGQPKLHVPVTGGYIERITPIAGNMRPKRSFQVLKADTVQMLRTK